MTGQSWYTRQVITRFETSIFTWIDVQNPTTEEIYELFHEFAFDTSIRDELANHIERSKVRFFNSHTYVVLQFPTSEGVRTGGKKTEVDFIIGTTYLITVHYETVGSVNEVANAVILENKNIKNPKDLFFHIVYRQYRNIGKQLEDLDMNIQETEHKIFGDTYKQTVENIAAINHQILDFKRALTFHKLLWAQLENNALFREESIKLSHEYQKLLMALEHYKEINDSLQNTNDSLIAYRTNEVMKFLTVVNFIALPVALVPTIISVVNFTIDPLRLLITIFTLSALIFILAKQQKWL